MQNIRRLFRWTEGLRIGRAERHKARLEPVPYRGVGVGLLKLHFRKSRDPFEIRQRRHVHDRKTRQFCLGDLDHQNLDRVVGVLRFLHRKANQIITGRIDVGGLDRVQDARQVAREDRPVGRLVAQLDANFGAVAIDEFCRLLPANQGHVVTRHQEFCRQQRAVRGPKDQNVTRHAPSHR